MYMCKYVCTVCMYYNMQHTISPLGIVGGAIIDCI